MANTNKRFSEAQVRYMAAAAAFNVIAAQVDVTDDVYCAAYQAKVDAERALYAWCRDRVASDPKTARRFGAHASDIDRLFSDAWKFPTIRAKLTDCCLKLAAA